MRTEQEIQEAHDVLVADYVDTISNGALLSSLMAATTMLPFCYILGHTAQCLDKGGPGRGNIEPDLAAHIQKCKEAYAK